MNQIILKHYLVLLFSIALMLWGIYSLYTQIDLVMHLYPNLIENNLLALDQSFTQRKVLQYIFLVSSINFIATAYGLALLIKPNHLVKTAHFIVGVLIILVTLYANYHLKLNPSDFLVN
jgi:hypothetical protein